jgi:hypothetical protein
MVVALAALTLPGGIARSLLFVAAVLTLYVGIVVCLRASGLLVTDHTIPRLHKREVFGVFAALVVASLLTGTVAVELLASNTSEPRANPSNQGCNGYIELCPEPINQIVWPASHNAMASSAYNFLGAEHAITIPEQLNAGARFLMIDAYYGYDDNGLVRTNLAGGVNRAQLRKERGAEAVRELDRLGALTGVADTSGKKQDVYLCHSYCELGAVKATDIFHDVDTYLSQNLTDVVVLDVEDYVQPKDLKRALVESGLWRRVWKRTPQQTGWPTLLDLVTPKHKGDDENPRRVIMMSEKHADEYPWLLSTYEVSQETPFTYASIAQFDCLPMRGGTDKSFFIVNHSLDAGGIPDPVQANTINSRKVLTARLQQCINERKQLPNAIAVNFTSQGDLFGTVNLFNAAIARQSGVTAIVSKTIQQLSAKEDITDAELRELKGLHRLPKISEKSARKLLGPLADSIPAPRELRTFASPCPNGSHPATKAEIKAAKEAAKQRAAADTTTTTTDVTAETTAPAGTEAAPEPTTTTAPPAPFVLDGCVAD